MRVRLRGGDCDDGVPIDSPVLCLNGAKLGPVLWRGTTLHGIKIVGAEIVGRVIRQEMDPRSSLALFWGRPSRIQVHSSNIDTPRPALDRIATGCSPGDRHGSLSQRLAYTRYHDGVSNADLVVDIHANATPAVPITILRTGEGDVYDRARRMAESYRMTILESNPKRTVPSPSQRSGLRMDAAIDDGKPAITLEFEAWSMPERWVKAGVTATLNQMKRFAMIPGDEEPIDGVEPIDEPLTTQIALRAGYGGVIHHLVQPGTRVAKGDPVARIIDRFGDERELLTSPIDGYLLCYPRYLNQTVMTGDEAVYIAPFRAA